MTIKTTADLECGDLVRLKDNPEMVWRISEVIDKFTVHLEYKQREHWFSGGVMDVSYLKFAE